LRELEFDAFVEIERARLIKKQWTEFLAIIQLIKYDSDALTHKRQKNGYNYF